MEFLSPEKPTPMYVYKYMYNLFAVHVHHFVYQWNFPIKFDTVKSGQDGPLHILRCDRL